MIVCHWIPKQFTSDITADSWQDTRFKMIKCILKVILKRVNSVLLKTVQNLWKFCYQVRWRGRFWVSFQTFCLWVSNRLIPLYISRSYFLSGLYITGCTNLTIENLTIMWATIFLKKEMKMKKIIIYFQLTMNKSLSSKSTARRKAFSKRWCLQTK